MFNFLFSSPKEKGESDIEKQKTAIDENQQEFEKAKRDQGEIDPKDPKENLSEFHPTEKNKVIELNAEKVNEKLADLITSTYESEKQLNDTLYGNQKGFFGFIAKGRKWFSENFTEKYFNIKIEDYRKLKGIAKVIGGVLAFMGGNASLNPILGAYGAKTAVDGLIETIKYFYEGKRIKKLRNAIFNNFEIIAKGTELRNKIKVHLGPDGKLEDITDITTQIEVAGQTKSINQHLTDFIFATRDQNKIISEEFPEIKRLEKIYGNVRFVAGLLASVGATGWIGYNKLTQEAAQNLSNNQFIDQAANSLQEKVQKDAFSLGFKDYDGDGIAHEVIKVNNGYKFIYNQTDLIAQDAKNGWHIFKNTQDAINAGMDKDSIKLIQSLGEGNHVLKGGAKLKILSAPGGQLAHSLNLAIKLNHPTLSSATNNISAGRGIGSFLTNNFENIKNIGGALLYSITSGVIDKNKASEAQKIAQKDLTLADINIKPAKIGSETEKIEAFFASLNPNDILISQGIISSPAKGKNKKYYQVLNKIGVDKLEVQQIKSETYEKIGKPIEIKKNDLYNELISLSDKNLDQLNSTQESQNKKNWEQWTNKNLINENSIINLKTDLKNIKGKKLDQNVAWKISQISPEKGIITLKAQIGNKIIPENIYLKDLQNIIDSTTDKIIISLPATNTENSSPSSNEPYLEALKNKVDDENSLFPDNINNFNQLKNHIWKNNNTNHFFRINYKNKSGTRFHITTTDINGKNPKKSTWEDSVKLINNMTFIR